MEDEDFIDDYSLIIVSKLFLGIGICSSRTGQRRERWIF